MNIRKINVLYCIIILTSYFDYIKRILLQPKIIIYKDMEHFVN